MRPWGGAVLFRPKPGTGRVGINMEVGIWSPWSGLAGLSAVGLSPGCRDGLVNGTAHPQKDPGWVRREQIAGVGHKLQGSDDF